MNKIVAIHQPNFFPWLGYFDKIARSDEFIFLDDVQFVKTGGVWTNRVKFIISGNQNWFTASVDRNYHGFKSINEIFFLNSNFWKKKLLTTLELNYKKHPFYFETMDLIVPLIEYDNDNVSDFNINAIEKIHSSLATRKTIFTRSSNLKLKDVYSSELLSKLVRVSGGTSYLCGGGSSGYLNKTIFKKNNQKIIMQNFNPFCYHQKNNKNDFFGGLSIIDVLMNLGFEDLQSRFIKEC